MSIAISSEDLPISKVDEYVENYLTPQISRITGVGLVDYHGQQKPAIRVQINPMVASAMGVSLEDIRAAVVTATVNVPKGTLDPSVEALVGYVGSQYIRIDTTTGAITNIGALTGGWPIGRGSAY